jgi:hypothetical protein
MIDFREVITYNDQPVTCPDCGSRTEIILDLSHTIELTQIHKCLSENCLNEFVTQNDGE